MSLVPRTQTHQELADHLKALHLPTIKGCYQEQAELARRESLSYEQYLLELVTRECEIRHYNRTMRLLRESRLPLEKSLETFDRQRLPQKVNTLVNTLIEGAFLDRAENLLAFGPPGVGKTHLLCGIAQALIYQGRRILFLPCNLLVQDLLAAKRDLTLPRLLARLGKYDALLIDDIGYVQHSREEMEVLFSLLSHRYERKSLLITSNLPFSGWETIFKDPMTTAAAIDRLVHHCIILELNLQSYRLEQAQKTASDQNKAI
jgi:DNA replication protein DnaC